MAEAEGPENIQREAVHAVRDFTIGRKRIRMSYEYIDPQEKLGLKMVESMDDAGSWEFHKIAFWQHEVSGELYWATDSGCSCPSPWEDHDELADFTRLTEQGFPEFETAAMGWEVGKQEKMDFVSKAKELLRASV